MQAYPLENPILATIGDEKGAFTHILSQSPSEFGQDDVHLRYCMALWMTWKSACLHCEDEIEKKPVKQVWLTNHEVAEVALQVIHLFLRELAVVREHVHMSPNVRYESTLRILQQSVSGLITRIVMEKLTWSTMDLVPIAHRGDVT